jgi:hypothetical protein
MNNVMMPQSKNPVGKVVIPDLVLIKIPNWSKFNPRADRVNFSWFRLQNNFFHDQSVFLLSPDQKLLYIFILCEASKTNSDIVKIAPRYVCAIIGMIEQKVRDTLSYIADLGLIVLSEIHTPINVCGDLTSESRQNDDSKPSNCLTTNERTNERTDEQKRNRSGYSKEFDQLWIEYERKGDKKSAFREWTKLKLTADDIANLSIAIKAHNKAKPDAQYRKDFERFLKTDWQEWLKRGQANGHSHLPPADDFTFGE